MTVHLLRLAVGAEDTAHIARVQAERRQLRAGRPAVWTWTRNRPRREGELLDGGSLYWVVRGRILVRQPVLGLETATDPEGRSYCRLWLAAEAVATVPTPRRPFQGWRYLDPADAPADLVGGAAAVGEGDAALALELAGLGLL